MASAVRRTIAAVAATQVCSSATSTLCSLLTWKVKSEQQQLRTKERNTLTTNPGRNRLITGENMASDSNQQKVVLITGGSAGIGEASALQFAKLGYKVAISGRNSERLNKVREALKLVSPSKKDEDFLAIQADFEQIEQVESVVTQTMDKFKRLDLLVNNVGFPGKRRLLEDSDFFQDFQTILQVNLIAATRVAQLAAPHLIASKGVIIVVSSIADRLAMPTISYSVSKAGLSMLGKTLANALGEKGVRVVTVAPGPVRTNFAPDLDRYGAMTSFGRVAESEEVADLIVYLASEKAAFVHGCTVDVDGGTYAKFNNIFKHMKPE